MCRRPGPIKPVESVTTLPGALEDRASLSRLIDGADVVVHGAGAIKAADRDGFHRVNGAGTARLAEACAGQTTPPSLIYVSSLAARSPELSDYAASKRAGEEEITARGDRVHGTILRPAAVYGPGDKGTLALFRCMKLGILPAPNLDRARLSLIFVDDLCAAIVRLSSAPLAAGGIFEIRDAREGGYSWRQIAEAGGAHLGRRPICVPLPKLLTLAAATVNQRLARWTNDATLFVPGKVNELYHTDWVCRENPLAEQTDWRPAVLIDEGFRRTLDWYRSNRWL